VTSDADKQTIVNTHNDLRSRVAQGEESQGNPYAQPSASNMRQIVSVSLNILNICYRTNISTIN